MTKIIMCGLMTSLPLDLIIAPALYLRFGRPVGPARKEDEQDQADGSSRETT